MKENKCCGNCHFFTNEDVKGFGWCSHYGRKSYCNEPNCKAYEPLNNGWTEITPDNVDTILELSKNRFVDVLDSRTMVARMIDSLDLSLSFMAKIGGYYYYVLPELKK